MKIALVHDHLLHLGGSERVLISMHKTFPEAPIYTAFFDPDRTFTELRGLDIRTLPINRVRLFHRNHRYALPFLAKAFEQLQLSVDVMLCSSSGWAHGAGTDGRKVVYCYSPANWLYRRHHYVHGRDFRGAIAARTLRPWLTRWDQRMARSADRYLTSSSAVKERIAAAYGIRAEVIPPPVTIDPAGPQEVIDSLPERFHLNVSRLVAHKNVGEVVAAFHQLPREHLVVVGDGPLRRSLQQLAPSNVTFLGVVNDARLRWLYSHSQGVVSASHEDFGLTPLEAASFGRPSAVLRWGGFLDTVIDGETGVLFHRPEPAEVAAAIARLVDLNIPSDVLAAHAARFSEQAFIKRLRASVTGD